MKIKRNTEVKIEELSVELEESERTIYKVFMDRYKKILPLRFNCLDKEMESLEFKYSGFEDYETVDIYLEDVVDNKLPLPKGCFFTEKEAENYLDEVYVDYLISRKENDVQRIEHDLSRTKSQLETLNNHKKNKKKGLWKNE